MLINLVIDSSGANLIHRTASKRKLCRNFRIKLNNGGL
nr:MAG TPA: hypothetical protein [Caudoviricetes sp.]